MSLLKLPPDTEKMRKLFFEMPVPFSVRVDEFDRYWSLCDSYWSRYNEITLHDSNNVPYNVIRWFCRLANREHEKESKEPKEGEEALPLKKRYKKEVHNCTRRIKAFVYRNVPGAPDHYRFEHANTKEGDQVHAHTQDHAEKYRINSFLKSVCSIEVARGYTPAEAWHNLRAIKLEDAEPWNTQDGEQTELALDAAGGRHLTRQHIIDVRNALRRSSELNRIDRHAEVASTETAHIWPVALGQDTEDYDAHAEIIKMDVATLITCVTLGGRTEVPSKILMPLLNSIVAFMEKQRAVPEIIKEPPVVVEEIVDPAQTPPEAQINQVPKGELDPVAKNPPLPLPNAAIQNAHPPSVPLQHGPPSSGAPPHVFPPYTTGPPPSITGHPQQPFYPPPGFHPHQHAGPFPPHPNQIPGYPPHPNYPPPFYGPPGPINGPLLGYAPGYAPHPPPSHHPYPPPQYGPPQMHSHPYPHPPPPSGYHTHSIPQSSQQPPVGPPLQGPFPQPESHPNQQPPPVYRPYQSRARRTSNEPLPSKVPYGPENNPNLDQSPPIELPVEALKNEPSPDESRSPDQNPQPNPTHLKEPSRPGSPAQEPLSQPLESPSPTPTLRDPSPNLVLIAPEVRTPSTPVSPEDEDSGKQASVPEETSTQDVVKKDSAKQENVKKRNGKHKQSDVEIRTDKENMKRKRKRRKKGEPLSPKQYRYVFERCNG